MRGTQQRGKEVERSPKKRQRGELIQHPQEGGDRKSASILEKRRSCESEMATKRGERANNERAFDRGAE